MTAPLRQHEQPGSGHSPVRDVLVFPSSDPREYSAIPLLKAPGNPPPACLAPQVRRARSFSRAPDRVRAVREVLRRASPPSRSRSSSQFRGQVWFERSQGHFCTYLKSSSLLQCQGPECGAPDPSAALAAAAQIHLCGAPRFRSRRFREWKVFRVRASVEQERWGGRTKRQRSVEPAWEEPCLLPLCSCRGLAEALLGLLCILALKQ
ncbi:hypothetical protein NDU88_009125 [Pleurodeles waltl]|uniref:Uncharacterized protein n=1 Tax=Pleurodeles waltl TaxID=8319 RepID=A0AAV7PRC3_PLEWA|nr:hypothetical protein NDU88_009125 [Pleurodeles waltl]